MYLYFIFTKNQHRSPYFRDIISAQLKICYGEIRTHYEIVNFLILAVSLKSKRVREGIGPDIILLM